MKKKSTRKAVENFKGALNELREFSTEIGEARISDKSVSACYDLKVIILYKEFERLMLNCIVAAINNNTGHLSQLKGFEFPKHLTDEVCEYIVTGGNYFDFKGKSGLVQTLRNYLPDDHYLISTIKNKRYGKTLDLLSALRNFAAHESSQSKKRALQVTGQKRIGSAGSYLKANGGDRFNDMAEQLEHLADGIARNAPY